MSNVNELAAILDAKYPGWWLWRTAGGDWGLQVKREGQSESFVDSDLVTAMQSAVDWRFLELVPREPNIVYESQFKVVRPNDREWELQHAGRYFGRFKTKKMAMESIVKMVDWHQRLHDEWLAEFGWSREKIEGVDFRWSDKTFHMGMKRSDFCEVSA
jgi:hypothetical protein